MPRQTKAETDAEIIDCAAGLFARHGFARASIQEIADTLGYSKAGLLHHYRSKAALYDAVMERHLTDMRANLAKALAVPRGIERDRVLVEHAVDFTFKSPGMADFAQFLARETPEDQRFVELGLELIAALGIDFTAPDLARMARAFTALGGASFTARLATKVNLQREWRQSIIDAAMAALGYSTEPTPQR